MLTVESVTFAYPGGPPVFERLGFTAKAGSVLCILGPNGAGKSTLLRCLAGLTAVSAGSIRLGERCLATLSRNELGRMVGFVPQTDTPVFEFTVRTVVEMGRAAHLGWTAQPGPHDEAIAESALRRLRIDHLADRPYPQLSGGERQLVLIARALTQQPALLVLDEPISHLDLGRAAEVLDIVRGLADDGRLVIMTTHDPNHAFAVGDQTLIIAPGRPALVGATHAVVTELNLSETYGQPIGIAEVAGRVVCYDARNVSRRKGADGQLSRYS